MRAPQSLPRLPHSLEDKLGKAAMGDLQNYFDDLWVATQGTVDNLEIGDNVGAWIDLTYSPATAGDAQTDQHPLGRVPVFAVPLIQTIMPPAVEFFLGPTDLAAWTNSTITYRMTATGVFFRLWVV